MYAYVFPGQGSQKKGMGKDLFADFSGLVKTADDILGYSITDLCINNRDDKLKDTKYAQPAIYVVNTMDYLKRSSQRSERPNYFAGHSLGEFNALYASGIYSFEDGLRLVKKRAEIMSSLRNGAMSAVIGSTQDRIQNLLCKHNLDEVDFANFNEPNQIVLSGLVKDIECAEEILKDSNIRTVRLKVSGSFHSRYMKSANIEFIKTLEEISFRESDIPVVSSVTGRPYQDNVYELLSTQMYRPVKWIDTVEYMLTHGCYEIIELGGSRVLDQLILKIKKARALGSNRSQTKADSA